MVRRCKERDEAQRCRQLARAMSGEKIVGFRMKVRLERRAEDNRTRKETGWRANLRKI